MVELKLDFDEGIVLQTTEIGRCCPKEISIDELYLTNKNIICIYKKSNGLFAKSDLITDKIPISSIKVVNGKAQVMKVDDDDYGLVLQILFNDNRRELFVFYDDNNDKLLNQWHAALIYATTGVEIPQEAAAPKGKKSKEAFTGAALFAGVKEAFDAAKQTVASAIAQEETPVAAPKAEPEYAPAAPVQHPEEPRKYIFCSNCGEKLNAGSKFCNACGTPTSGAAPQTAVKPEPVAPPIPDPVPTPAPPTQEQRTKEQLVGAGAALFAGVKEVLNTAKQTVASAIAQEETPAPQPEPTPTPAAPTPPPVIPEYEPSKPTTERKTSYDGEIYKCPNCGDIMDAYESVCESCGYERRGAKATSSVRELSARLQAIEAQRPPKKHTSIFSQAMNQGHISKTDEQKIDLIKNFAIPNNKEDILEFAVLAVSNIDPDAFSTMNNASVYDASKKAISNAWMAKFEQAYQKGKLMFGDSPELHNIYQMYLDKKKSISKKKTGVWKMLGITYGILIAIIAVVLISVNVSNSTSKNEEEARLNNLVQQIETALDAEDYALALMHATRLDYSGPYNEDKERDWAIQQEYWINKIINKAAEDGIILERPTIDTEKEDTNSEPTASQTNNSVVSQDTIQQFINGYEKANFAKYDSSEEGTEFADSRIYFYCTLTQTEILEADGTTTILGHVTDDTDNKWLIQLHFVPGVSKTAFDGYVGQSVILRGVYSGYSSARNIPVVVLDEMIILETGENVLGMQKLLDE